MVYRARGQLGVGGVGGLRDLRGGKRTSLKRFTMIEGIRPETRANPVKEPPGGVRTTEPAPGEMEVSLKQLRGTVLSYRGYFLPKYGGRGPLSALNRT
jgi:hypothetical protein